MCAAGSAPNLFFRSIARSISRRALAFLLQSMRHDHDVLPCKEVKYAIVDALIRRAQLVDPVPKRIRRWAAKFVAFRFQLCDARHALDLDLRRLLLQPISNRNRVICTVEDDFLLRHMLDVLI